MSKNRKLTATGRSLEASWHEVLNKHSRWPKFARSPVQVIALLELDFTQIERRVAAYVKDMGTAKASLQYTGTKMLGIGTMHKSNSVPVFSQEEAEDIAKMRRG